MISLNPTSSKRQKQINLNLLACVGIFSVFLMMAASAQAHPGHSHLIGFSQGMQHPFSGIDHILVALMVGFLAGLENSGSYRHRQLWLPALAFVGSLCVGFFLNFLGMHVPFYEQGIVLSLLFLGLTMILERSWSQKVNFLVLLGMGFCHGLAHGSEVVPRGNLLGGFNQCLGVALSTVAILSSGFFLVHLMKQKIKSSTLWPQRLLLQTSGLAALVYAFLFW